MSEQEYLDENPLVYTSPEEPQYFRRPQRPHKINNKLSPAVIGGIIGLVIFLLIIIFVILFWPEPVNTATKSHTVAGNGLPDTSSTYKSSSGGTGYASLQAQTVYGNDGSVSCTKYCAGKGGKSWNDQLPLDWNGAICVKALADKVTCDDVPKTIDPEIKNINCVCRASGKGWAR